MFDILSRCSSVSSEILSQTSGVFPQTTISTSTLIIIIMSLPAFFVTRLAEKVCNCIEL